MFLHGYMVVTLDILHCENVKKKNEGKKQKHKLYRLDLVRYVTYSQVIYLK